MKLSGLNTLITGGSQGFGRQIVTAFLAEGAHVVFCARTAADVRAAEAALGSNLRPGQQLAGFVCNIAAPAEVAALFARVARLGPLHAVVNNAGIYGPIGPTDQVALEDWTQAWQVNVTGTFLVCQHAIRVMKPRRSGKIINVSGGGATSPMPRLATYAATKAAVVRLTETLAEEYRDDHIDVNAVAPGALRTRLTDQVLAAGPERAGAEFYAKNKQWAESGAVDPALGAALCVYLASPASNGITGKLVSAQWDPWRDLQKFHAELRSDIYTLRRIVPSDRGKNFSP
ncbi:MAG: SDR family NAD(P)-dependent oxidoreductase [Opitutales bacterium]